MADREEIRAELESTKAAYHKLLDDVSDGDWKKKTGNQAWTVKQMMSHLASGVAYTAGSVEMVRKGKGFNPPFANFLNVMSTRWMARKATPESVAEQYDAGYVKLLAALDTVQDDEWGKSSKFFGQTQTIEELFRSIPAHQKEHEPDIRKGMGA